jgi:hypothetical protein
MVGITNTTRAHRIIKNMPKIMLLSGGGAKSCGSFFAESDPVGSGKLTEKVLPPALEIFFFFFMYEGIPVCGERTPLAATITQIAPPRVRFAPPVLILQEIT